MGRHRSTRFTPFFPKSTAAVCPLSDVFRKQLIKDEDALITVTVLHDAYISVCSASNIEPAGIEKFGRTLTQFGINKTFRHGRTHYKCRLTKPVRTVHVRHTATKLHAYLDIPLADRHDPLARLFLGGLKQWGAKATKTLLEDDIVTEYRGTLITGPEAEVRVANHTARGLPDAVYKISANTYLDPYELDGEDVTTTLTNPGVWLNHTCKSPNCRTRICRYPNGSFRALVLVALKTVSLGHELTQDYNDKGEDWLND